MHKHVPYWFYQSLTELGLNSYNKFVRSNPYCTEGRNHYEANICQRERICQGKRLEGLGRPKILPAVFRTAGRDADSGTLQKGREDRRLRGVHPHIYPFDGQVFEDSHRQKRRSLIALPILPGGDSLTAVPLRAFLF